MKRWVTPACVFVAAAVAVVGGFVIPWLSGLCGGIALTCWVLPYYLAYRIHVAAASPEAAAPDSGERAA